MLFAKYPSAQLSEFTVAAWWDDLAVFSLPVVLAGLRSAARVSPQFCPTSPFVAEHCTALAKTTLGQPRPDLSVPALPEPMPEIDPGLREQFESINAQVRAGELEGAKAGAAYLRAILGRLE